MDWYSILGGALVGAAAGALGTLIAIAFARARGTAMNATIPGAIVASTIAVVTVTGASEAIGLRLEERIAPIFERTPVERMSGRMSRRLMREPELRAWVKQQAKAQKSSQDMQREMALVTAKGLVRLPNEQLMARMSVLTKVLTQSAEPACAMIARGTMDANLLAQTIANLPAQDVHAWTELTIAAALAEIRNQPPPRALTDDEAAAALTSLYAALPKREAEDLSRLLQSTQSATDAEMCWMARTLYSVGAGGDLSDSAREKVALMLAMQ